MKLISSEIMVNRLVFESYSKTEIFMIVDKFLKKYRKTLQGNEECEVSPRRAGGDKDRVGSAARTGTARLHPRQTRGPAGPHPGRPEDKVTRKGRQEVLPASSSKLRVQKGVGY